ncbi:MAG: hypothetical protein ABSH50_00030 [Bryobacteraceae bacterium]|jgi:hypothetical protein
MKGDLWLFAAAILAPAMMLGQYGQVATDAVTVSVSQPLTSPPSDVVFAVTVNSPLGAAISDAVAPVASVGITAGNLTNVTSTVVPNPTAPPALAWNFQLTVPFANQKAIATALVALEGSLAQNGNGFSLSFSLSGSSPYGPSPQACNVPGLLASARTQAQSLALAAGQNLGSIMGLTTTATNVNSAICTLSVKFGLGYQSGGSAPNLITINVAQVSGAQSDAAVLVIGVASGLNTALDDVTGALQAAGIGGTTFAGVTTFYLPGASSTAPPQMALGWTFELTTPVSNLGVAVKQLTAAQQAFQTQSSGLMLAYAVGGAFMSQPASCSYTGMLSEAQTEAQQLAGAAGVNAGSVLNLATNSSVPAIPDFQNFGAYLWETIAAETNTSVTTTTTGTTSFGIALGSSPLSTCTMAAQFQLL